MQEASREKKAASYVKKKLPSKTKVLKTTKKVLNKVKSGAAKKISKAKSAIPKGSVKSAAKKYVKKTARDATVSGVTEGTSNKIRGGKFSSGFKSGFVNGAVTSVVSGKTNSSYRGNLAGGLVSSILDARGSKEKKSTKRGRIIANTLVQTFVGGSLDKLSGMAGADEMLDSINMSQKVGGWTATGMFQVFNLGAGLTSNFIVDSVGGQR